MTGYEIATLVIQSIGITSTVILSVIGIVVSLNKRK
ncbi:hypothetical protein ABID96_001909 [Bacillus sp. OAE603]